MGKYCRVNKQLSDVIVFVLFSHLRLQKSIMRYKKITYTCSCISNTVRSTSASIIHSANKKKSNKYKIKKNKYPTTVQQNVWIVIHIEIMTFKYKIKTRTNPSH